LHETHNTPGAGQRAVQRHRGRTVRRDRHPHETGRLRELVCLPPHFSEKEAADAVAEQAAGQVGRYLADPDFTFCLPLADAGSDFQRKVWAAISAIPRGAVRSYGQLARHIGSAPRAVGQACGANWLPPVIPAWQRCRGLGGFSYATKTVSPERQRWLLTHGAAAAAPHGSSKRWARAPAPFAAAVGGEPGADRRILRQPVAGARPATPPDTYRRDMRLFARWLQVRRPACATRTRSNRTTWRRICRAPRRIEVEFGQPPLSVLKRFYQLALRQKQVAADPCLKMASARQPDRFVHTLTEPQVEALLGAPDVATPLGLRERTMLELMYASGLRVSELVNLKLVELSLNDGVLRDRRRQDPAGAVGQEAPLTSATRRTPARSSTASSTMLFGHARRADDAPDVLDIDQKTCGQGADRRAAVAAHAAPRVRHPPAEPRRRLAGGAVAAGTRRYFHHANLHPCCARAPETLARRTPPTWLIQMQFA
jgi:O-6-methylguanine DNA methyltransferase